MKGNNIVRSVNPYSLFEDVQNLINSTTTITQGELVYLDTVNHLIKPVAAEANSATFLGAMPVSVVNGKIQSPYNTNVVASQAIQAIPGPKLGVVCKLTAKTGDAFVPGQKVALDPATGTDAVGTIITTASVGLYQGPAIAAAVAGQQIEVLLTSAYAQL